MEPLHGRGFTLLQHRVGDVDLPVPGEGLQGGLDMSCVGVVDGTIEIVGGLPEPAEGLRDVRDLLHRVVRDLLRRLFRTDFGIGRRRHGSSGLPIVDLT